MANIFKDFFNKISGLVGGGTSSGSVLGIDIGASSIKVVQLELKNNTAVLQTYGEIALGPYADIEIGRATNLGAAKLAEALKDLLKESNVSTLNTAMSIPMKSSMVSVFEMPNIDQKQLNQMVPIEARKYIPVPIAEVSLDWFVIPSLDNQPQEEKFQSTGNTNQDEQKTVKPKLKNLEIMVVAIHNDVLSEFSNLVGSTTLKTSFFEIEMFSTARAVLDANYLNPVMIVDIGAGATKLYITEKGIVRDSHVESRGSQDLTLNIARSLNIDIAYAEKLKRTFGENETETDAKIMPLVDNIFNPIFGTANRMLLDYQKKYNKNVTKVIMVGGGSLLNGIDDKAKKYFAADTVLGDPFDKVQTPAFLDPVLKETGVMFAGAIGLALRKLQELG
jgi:type IV pilus assembly protein PilM